MTTDISARVVAPAVGQRGRTLPRWPLFLIALPAAVAVWSGWVGLGTLSGFGIVHPLPGIWDSFKLNTAITLPVGVEAYGAYALGAWLAPGAPGAARAFARRSALGALGLGMAGQVIYHLLAAWHAVTAPWPVVMLVSCLPVVTLGFGGALTHLLRTEDHDNTPDDGPRTAQVDAVPLAGKADSAPAIEADTNPARTVATDADTAPAPRRTRRGPSTADRVAAMRAKYPDMPTSEMARRLKLSDRTVRRYLPARPTDDELQEIAA